MDGYSGQSRLIIIIVHAEIGSQYLSSLGRELSEEFVSRVRKGALQGRDELYVVPYSLNWYFEPTVAPSAKQPGKIEYETGEHSAAGLPLTLVRGKPQIHGPAKAFEVCARICRDHVLRDCLPPFVGIVHITEALPEEAKEVRAAERSASWLRGELAALGACGDVWTVLAGAQQRGPTPPSSAGLPIDRSPSFEELADARESLEAHRTELAAKRMSSAARADSRVTESREAKRLYRACPDMSCGGNAINKFLTGLAFSPACEQPLPRVSVQVHLEPKAGRRRTECQDAAAIGAGNRVLCVSDGASQASFSAAWARCLCARVLEDFFPFSDSGSDEAGPPDAPGLLKWSAPAVRNWAFEVPWERLKLPAKVHKAMRGSAATMVAVHVEEDSNSGNGALRYHGWAIGDSCCIHLRNGEKVSCWPMSAADEFDSYPTLIYSWPQDDEETEKTVQAMMQEDGVLHPGDTLLLASDALSKHVLRAFEEGLAETLLAWIQSMQDAPTEERTALFAGYIADQREGGSLEDDDVALVLLSVDPPPDLEREEASEAEDGGEPESDSDGGDLMVSDR